MSKPGVALIVVVVAVVAVIALLRLTPGRVPGQSAASQGGALTTAWGAPDLQGIWTDEYDTPLQRAAKYAGREFFTEAEIAELDKQRAALLGREYRDRDANGRGTEQDVAGAYNALFESHKHTGRRTSLVVDPPDGRIPPLTPETQKRRAALREFQLALLQATESCKNRASSCREGKYGPPSPKRFEQPPIYSTDRLNRADGPEDRSMTERCMAAQLPDVGGFRRIIQSPESVSVFYDVGQGQGWQRVIPIGGGPHLPSSIRQRFGDSRGHWEGNTLVVDVTNFSFKTDFRGSIQNLHLVERWTRTDANTLEYAVTIEDPTTWTGPWTVKHEMRKQNEEANRFYMEPRCHEGNYGMIGMLLDTRAVERAFAEGRGADPATLDIAIAGAGGGEENQDPLAGGQ